MSADDNLLPDWLRQLRDEQVGSDFQTPGLPAPAKESAPAPQVESVAEPAPPVVEEAAPETPEPVSADEFDALRQKASIEPPVEEPPKRKIPIIGQLNPFQRFVLALMLFLNVSVLGCLFLLVAGKIALVR